MHSLAALLPGLGAVALWGASFVAIRVALEGFAAVGLVATRLAMGAALLLALARASGGVLPERGDRRRCVVLGAVLGVHLLIQSQGLVHTTAVRTGWIIAVIPVVIALGARLVHGSRLTPLRWAGVAVGFAGVGLVTLDEVPSLEQAGLGDLLALTSCFTWAAFTLLSVRVVASSGSLRVTAVSMVVACLFVLPATPFVELVHGPLTARVWLATLFLGVFCSAVAYLWWNLSLKRAGPVSTGALLYTEPLFTLGASALVLDEPFGAWARVGGPLVLVGVFLASRAPSGHGDGRRQPADGQDSDRLPPPGRNDSDGAAS